MILRLLPSPSATPSPERMDVSERTPIVTVELQLRPQPPKGSTPWFWDGGMLDFHERERRDVKVVWRAELPKSVRLRSARVQQHKDFGWVLVLRFTHADAEALLAGLSLPKCVEGQEAPYDSDLRAAWGRSSASGLAGTIPSPLGTRPLIHKSTCRQISLAGHVLGSGWVPGGEPPALSVPVP